MYVSYWLLAAAAFTIIYISRKSAQYEREADRLQLALEAAELRAEGLSEILAQADAKEGRFRAAEERILALTLADCGKAVNNETLYDEREALRESIRQALDYVDEGKSTGRYSNDPAPWDQK